MTELSEISMFIEDIENVKGELKYEVATTPGESERVKSLLSLAATDLGTAIAFLKMSEIEKMAEIKMAS